MIEVTAIPVDDTPTDKKQGRSFFQQLKSLVIGAGASFVGIDERGIWAGAKDFATAPFRVDMQGNVTGIGLSGQTITGSTISGGTISGATITGGSIAGTTIVGGTIKTSESPDRVELNGADEAIYLYSGGVKVVTLTNGIFSFNAGVSLKNTATPFSGVGSMSIEHDTGTLAVEVGGSGEGEGSRYILIRNADASAYFALIDNDNGTFSFELVGLPTSNPGPNKLWKNGNVITMGT